MRRRNNPDRRVPDGASRRSTNVVDPYRTATEFSRLIIKLRWIGSEDEANALARYLARVAPREFAFVPPMDTD
jgi:hypothetical protein